MGEELQNMEVCYVACAICLDEMVPCESITRLPCNHDYHTNCIKRWNIYGNGRIDSCPMCRKNCETGIYYSDESEEESGEERSQGVYVFGVFTKYGLSYECCWKCEEPNIEERVREVFTEVLFDLNSVIPVLWPVCVREEIYG